VPVPGGGPFIQSFFIYRSNGGPFVILDSVPASSGAYTDINPAQGLNLYQVSMRQTTSCAITLKPSTASSFTESRSNIISTTFTGIDEPVKHHFFEVYPNPASGEITLELQQGLASVMVEIHDMQGRLMYQNREFSGGKTKLSMMPFSKGYYLIKVDAEGKSYYRKLVIQ
jgi:hypothetical protein